jgi:anthranilate phosphoribosyltransferase
MTLGTTLERLLRREDLTETEAGGLVARLADEATPAALAGAVLVALRAKGERPEEIRGLARALRERARPAGLDATGAVDVAGTGRDGSGSLNLSTGSALLAAACGARVIKHGDRAQSSRAGSADVMEALGLTLPLAEPRARACFEATGFTFLYAPYYHPALAALTTLRRTLGVATVLDLLEPLCNPATPPYAVIGACDVATAALIADALAGMPSTRAFVVHGAPRWDEPTPVGPFVLYDVHDGAVHATRRDPLDFGVQRCLASELAGGDAAYNAARLRAVFRGEDRGPHREALALGCALALEVTGTVADLEEGRARALAALDDGAAAALLDAVVAAGAAPAAEGA